MMIIGISGKKLSGKTDITKYLIERFEALHLKVEHYYFAEPLKQLVLDLFVPRDWELSVEDLELEENKNGKVIRLLRCSGTDKDESEADLDKVQTNTVDHALDLVSNPFSHMITNDVSFYGKFFDALLYNSTMTKETQREESWKIVTKFAFLSWV